MTKTVAIVLAVLILIPIVFALVGRLISFGNLQIVTENGIQESEYVELGGIEQYVKIRGQNKDNPVVIFLHGGPGGSLSYIMPTYQQPLEKKYTFVNWDQRGCGRTYYKNENAEVTYELLENDLDELVDYVCKKLGKERVFILGYSWGTVLGSNYVQKHPEKVMAYFSAGQVINGVQGEIYASEQAMKAAKAEGKQKMYDEISAYRDKLETMTKDNFDINEFMKNRANTAHYLTPLSQKSSFSMVWAGMTSSEMNLDDIKWTQKTSEELFNSQNGIEKELLNYFMFEYNAYDDAPSYDVPVYFIIGENDMITPCPMVQEYCDSLRGTNKTISVIPGAGHNAFFDKPGDFNSILQKMLDVETVMWEAGAVPETEAE